MIKALIVEDELYIRKGLISMIESLDKEIDIIGECESVQEAVTVTKACKPELVFLDINLKDGIAFDFLDQVKDLNFQIIFITAYDQYALQAIKNGAIDYILKPVDIDELSDAIDRVKVNSESIQPHIEIVKEQFVENKREHIVLRLQEGYQIIRFDTLMYCQSDKGYTTFYTEDKKSYIASKPIKEFENQLPEELFVRTHQSYVVNLKFIDKYDKTGYAFLKSGAKIPVSTRKREEFVSRLLL
ncbi:LytR/AlgR family response regulator transcription factor [Tenacibaculum jejuense]|uniref:Two-component system response regulatory protein, LytTR family n=1 Tax=Tenacibaculum jejuense TaxID=584609 RepID=A0A238UCF8_9FLAO|nr:LytTR family DNA-binding domain-containing protein [Tenacibaculum jejuense]SNR16248.1 Two-component system response regulatory protein, LytTR family [Tenacibaculum jejuense]